MMPETEFILYGISKQSYKFKVYPINIELPSDLEDYMSIQIIHLMAENSYMAEGLLIFQVDTKTIKV